MSEAVTEAPEATTQVPVSVDNLLAEYTALRNNKASMTAEEFDKAGRTLRRKIRNAGGSVRELTGEASPAERVTATEKPKKGRTTKRRIEAEISAAKAQPASLAHVDWVERVLSGQEQIADQPAIALANKTQAQIEKDGLYGFGLDLLSDVTAHRAVEKFYARFETEPLWFCMMKPADYSQPNAVTLLILGPTPVGMFDTPTPSAEAQVTEQTPPNGPDDDGEPDEELDEE